MITSFLGRFFLLASLCAAFVRSSDSRQFSEAVNTAQQLQHWTFSNGPEFPGASGSLSIGPNATGAVLNVKLSCSTDRKCGHYVAAVRELNPPVALPSDHPVLKFLVGMSSGIKASLRVKDESGQTVEYDIQLPDLEHPAYGPLEEATVPLWTRAAAHWGGANTGVVKGKLTEIAILAVGLVRPVQGQLRFNQVSLSSSPAVGVAPSAGLLPAPAGSASLEPLLGVNIHSGDSRALDVARDTGFSFVRSDITWTRVERGNSYDFSSYDQLEAQLRTRGLGVLWLLGYGHPNHGGKYPRSPEDLAAFGKYAAAVAAHFKGSNARFEIWNEPDGTLGDPKAFGSVVHSAAEAIRQVNPTAQVSSGGISNFNRQFFEAFLSPETTAGLSAIGFHGYRDEPETVRRDLSELQGIVDKAAGRPIPVWDTEWGYSSYSNQIKQLHIDGHSAEATRRQAILGTREILSAWASGFPVIVWYDLIDDNNNAFDKEGNFGLLNQDHTPKPVLVSVTTLLKMAKNRRYAGLLAGLPNGIHAMRLQGGSDLVLVLWNDRPQVPEQVELAGSNLLAVSDMFGRDIQGAKASSGATLLNLAEGDGPVYVRYSK